MTFVVCMCMCENMCVTVYVWSSEDHLWKEVLSFHHMGQFIEL